MRSTGQRAGRERGESGLVSGRERGGPVGAKTGEIRSIDIERSNKQLLLERTAFIFFR